MSSTCFSTTSIYAKGAGKALLGLCFCLSTLVHASDHTPPYDERLLPVAQTFLTLQLCSSYATHHEHDVPNGDRYSRIAWDLHDAAINAGWEKQLFSSAMVVAHEQRSLLEVREDDTPDSFKRRHQSGEPCESAITTAQAYLSKVFPAPP